MDRQALIDRYAELAIRVGVNLQPGQHLLIEGLVEHREMIHAAVKAAYAAGAGYVEVEYGDQHVRKEMVRNVEEDLLTWSPPHLLKRLTDLAEVKGAFLVILGDPEPELFADLDPGRVGRAHMLEAVEESTRQVNERTVSWAVVACPNDGWAEAVFGERDADRLWDAVARATRLYEEDPVGTWWDRVEELGRRADAMNTRHFDSLRYEGPGTDLTVGLLEGSRWMSARFETRWGQHHVPNLPTEEIFTSPDFRRTQGVVTASRPLQIPSAGVTVRDLKLRFEKGKAVEVEATQGEGAIRAQLQIDDQAPFLGEVALVDKDSAVGRTGLTFGNTLFDENATCHLAYGAGFLFCVEGADGLSREGSIAAGLNHSAVHTDFMIGGPELSIYGVTKDGGEVPLIVDDTWQL
ncbi:MAG: aminopeptidase [Actinomycetota bacterium]